eukprot:5419369-Pyramimonas_sp.AAC.1
MCFATSPFGIGRWIISNSSCDGEGACGARVEKDPRFAAAGAGQIAQYISLCPSSRHATCTAEEKDPRALWGKSIKNMQVRWLGLI